MSRFYILILCVVLSAGAFGQFRKGYDISYNTIGAIPSVVMTWDESFMGTNVFTNEGSNPVGGIQTITKTGAGSIVQGVMNMDNGQPLDIDFKTYPYATIRIRVSHPSDLTFNFNIKDIGNSSQVIKGNNVWNIVRFDCNKNKIANYFSNFIQWSMSGESTFPYTIDIDYIKLGNLGDPDTTVKMGIAEVTPSPIIVEKDAGQQTVNLSGITNGIDVSKLSLSLTSSKGTIFESTPTFSAIQPDGTATLSFTPKTGTVGSSTEQVLLTYNSGDTVIKYKSIWFDINIATDPKMTVGTTVNAQMNQPKVNIKVTAATNSIGGSSKLKLEATATKNDLVTNITIDGDTVKSDGTATISFIPGLDKCGQDTITAVLTDKNTTRFKEYKIVVNVNDPSNLCSPEAMASVKEKLELFPNPADDKTTVILPTEKGYTLSVVDITGRTVQQIIVNAGQTEAILDVSKLNAGIYFVSASNGSQKIIKKLTVK